MKCPKCGSENVTVQAINERKGAGCFTIILYIILAISVLGWLILIPLLLRKKDKTSTYAVCQNCGNRWKP